MATLSTFLTVDELAEVLRCQPEKVYRPAARGELSSYRVEGRRLFDEGEWEPVALPVPDGLAAE